jgi:hypothetical protein
MAEHQIWDPDKTTGWVAWFKEDILDYDELITPKRNPTLWTDEESTVALWILRGNMTIWKVSPEGYWEDKLI